MIKQRYAEFIVLLTSDKKKASVLAILLVVAVGLMGKLMLTSKPTSASAAGGQPSSAGSSDLSGEVTADAGSEFEILPLVMLPQTGPLTRDLFAPGPEFRRQPLQTDQPEDSGPKSASGSDDKTPVSPELRRLELERAVREEASRLHLSSTMVGSNPIAVIQQDGKDGERTILRIGESIDGFELLEVSARNAVLNKNGIRVELNIGRR